MPDRDPPTLRQEEIAAILDAAMDAIISVDGTDRIQHFNSAAEEMFGCSAAEAVGSSLSRFIPERFRAAHAQQVRTFEKTGRTTRGPRTFGDIVGLRANGEEFPIQASIARLDLQGRKILTVNLRDMSEEHRHRKRTEAAEQTLSTLIGNLPGVVYRCRNDRKWTMEFMSEGALAITGYEPRELVDGPIGYGELISSEHRVKAWDVVQAAVEKNQHYSVQYQIKHKDGSLRWVSERGVGARAPDGEISLEGFIQDIDSAHRSALERRKSETRFRTLAENAPVVIFTINPAGDCLYVNPKWSELSGLPAESALGSHWIEAIHPEDRPRVAKEFTEAVAHGGEVLQLPHQRFQRPDGTISWLSGSAVAVRAGSGKITGYLGYLSDLSERHHAEESDRLLASIVDASDDAIAALSPEGEVLSWNAAAERMMGFSAAEMLGTPISRLVPEDERPEIRRHGDQVRAGHGIRNLVGKRIRKDGKLVDLSITVSPLLDANGHVMGSALVARDLTQHLQDEREIKATEHRAQAAEKLAAVSTLTASIAHDVGAPMTAILGYAELMQKSLADETNRKRATIIVEQANRISQLIQGLLNMARPGKLVAAPLELAQLLDESIDFYREKLRAHAIEVKRSFSALPRFYGDRNQLQQVFLNLIINAVDAMPHGGVLSVKVESPDPRHIEVRFADNGTGINEEMLPRVFEPFVTSKDRGSGTGLGLVVVKNIVEEHGGRISVESQLGKGTEFAVQFEVTEA